MLLTDLPTGSAVDVTLSWPAPPDNRLWRYVDRLLMALFLCGWARALVWPVGQLANGNLDWFLVGWVGFWALCGGLFAWTLLASFRPARPESVRLEAGGPAARPRRLEAVLGSTGGREADPGRPVGRPRGRSRVGRGRSRLYLDLGTGWREVGAALVEGEREWVCAVLQRWHAAESSRCTAPL